MVPPNVSTDRWNHALIEKGLRLVDAAALSGDQCWNHALIEKGLRPAVRLFRALQACWNHALIEKGLRLSHCCSPSPSLRVGIMP